MMAFSPVAFIAPNYRDYKNWWLKAYEPSTTTPKAMAIDSGGVTQVAKLELNADGFIVTAGGALVIPYIDGSYDLWLFPTEDDADNSDTSNAERLADDANTSYGANDLSQEYIFKTVAEYKNSTIEFPDGKRINLLDRNAVFTKITGTGSGNDINIIASTGEDQSIQLSIESDLNATAFGVVYDDAADQTTTLEAASSLLGAQGFYLEVSGVVKCNLGLSNENVYIRGAGELQPFTRTSSALVATADFGSAYAISAIVTVDQTVGARSQARVSKVTAVGHDIIIGDTVKIVSEDIIPTTTISEGCRNGEWGNVLDVVGDDIYLNRVLEESYTTTPRIAAISNYECDIQTSISSTTGNGSAGGALAIIRGFKRPKINMTLTDNDGVGLALHSTYEAEANIEVENCTNDTGSGIFGYGVVEAGTGLSQLHINQAGFVRHVYTTGVASKTDTAIYTYGEPWNSNIHGVSHGATSNAWDTHSQGNGIIFNHVEAYGVQSMFQSRSRGTRAIHPSGSDMLFLAQARSSDAGTQAELEITGCDVRRVKKPFNFKDDSASSNAPTVILRGDNYVSYEPSSASAAIDSVANLTIDGTLTMKMLGGTDENVIAQTGGSINIYGKLLIDTADGACTKPFRISDSDFTVHGNRGALVQIKSALIGKLFTATDAPSALTSNVKCNSIETDIAVGSSDWLEFPMNEEQLTIRNDTTQTDTSAFQFINTGSGNTDVVFNSLDSVVYLQFSTQTAPDDTLTSISDGQFAGQQLFIENANSVTLNIPNSISNVEYTKSISVGATDTLTWRGTYWA